MCKNKKVWFCLGGVLLGIILSVGIAQGVKYSSTEEFCSSCHEMKFAYEAWEENAHGPLSGDAGACKATCVDCHLPHDANVVSYLFIKTEAAVKDVIGHVTGPEKFDWAGNLEERNRYTYESSCKRCHKALSNNVMHQKYKSGETDKTCIDCHHGIGHGYYFREEVERLFGKKEVAKK